MDLFELTRALIDIPSVTGEEGAVGRFLVAHLEQLGYAVQLQQVEGDRCNLVAVIGAPCVYFSTHMDTVPPHIPSSDDETHIYGRGACDAKGIIAAQICAAESLRESGLSDIGLLFTVDEEMGSLGAQTANRLLPKSPCHYLINGEPTDNRLANGTKGSLRCLITAEGRAAHSAYPEQGESAVEKLLDILEDIRRIAWPPSAIFGETTCNIGVIGGGTRPNVVPAEAYAELQIRLATTATGVEDLLEQTVAGRARIDYLSVHDPVRLMALSGFEAATVRFTTDIPYLSKWGAPLLLGPGSILVAHTEHERVAKAELIEAVELYVQLVQRLLSESPAEGNT